MKNIIIILVLSLLLMAFSPGPTGPTDPLIIEKPIGIFGGYSGFDYNWNLAQGTNVYVRNDLSEYGSSAIVGHGVGTNFANYGYGVVGMYEQTIDNVVIGKGAAGVLGYAKCFPSVNTCAGVKGEGLTGGLFIGEMTPLRVQNIDNTAYLEVDHKGNLHTNGCLIVNEGTPNEQVYGICN